MKKFVVLALIGMAALMIATAAYAYDSWWDPAGADGWGVAPDWHHRLPLTLSKPAGQDTADYSGVLVQEDIDFLSIGYDGIDTASPRILRRAGTAWDTISLNAFNWIDQGGIAGYDKCALRFLVHQDDLVDSGTLSVKYYLYFDTGTGKPDPGYPAINYPSISDTFDDTSKISSQTNVLIAGGRVEISSAVNTWTQTSQIDFGGALEKSNVETLTVPGSVKLESTSYSVNGTSGWKYRKKITVSEPGVIKRIDAPCKVILSFAQGRISGAFQEIRVTDTAGTVVPDTITGYSTTNGWVTSCTLVFLVNCNTAAIKDYYVYYGNSSAVTPSYPIFRPNTGGSAYADDGDSAGALNAVTPHYSRTNLSAGIETYTTSNNLGVGDDNSTLLSLPWNVKFFGDDLAALYVSSNGLATRATNADYTNTAQEFQGSYSGMIAPFWDDLYPHAQTPTPGVFQDVYSDPDRFVWTWREVHYNGAGNNNRRRRYFFQLIIYSTGDIAFRYERLDNIITNTTTNRVNYNQAIDQGDAPGNRTVGISRGNNLNWLRSDNFIAGDPTTTPGAFYQCADAFTTAIGSEEQPPPPYKTYGYFVSQKYDAGSKAVWKNISWSADTSGLGTSVKFQTRTANSASELDTSSWSDTYAAGPSQITSPNGRWVQYRAVLQTNVPDSANLNYTPRLDDVSISCQKYEASAQIISTATAESPPILSVIPAWSESMPAGTTLNIFFSNDNGLSYSAVSNGVQHTFGSSGNNLRYKAEFSSPGDTTPVLFGVSASYIVQQTEISQGSPQPANPYASVYGDSSYSSQRTVYSQGETVYGKSFVLFTSASESSVWTDPGGDAARAGYIVSDTAAFIFDSYTLAPAAHAGTWTLASKTPSGNTVAFINFTCQNSAAMACSSQSAMPAYVNQGQSNVKSQALRFNNNVSAPGAPAVLDTFVLTFKDGSGADTPVDNLLSSVMIKKGGTVLQQVSSPSGSSLLVNFSGSPQTVNAGETLSIDIYLNFKVSAPLGATLKTQVTDTAGIGARDANSGAAVSVSAFPGWPLASDTCFIQQGPSIATYFNIDCTQLQDIFSQGQFVYAKAIKLDTATVFRCRWINPSATVVETHTLNSDDTGTLFDSCTLSSFAETGSWTLDISTLSNTPVCSANFSVQYKAFLFLTSVSSMPDTAPSSSGDHKSQTIYFYNNTPSPGANLKIETFVLSFKDEDSNPLNIGGIISKVKIKEGLTDLQVFNSPSGDSITVNFNNSPKTVNCGETFPCDIMLEIASGVSGGLIFRTQVSDSSSVIAKDLNFLSAVSPSAISWPLASESTTVQAGISATYRDSARTIQQNNFSQGQTVYAKTTGLVANKGFTVKWVSPSGTTVKTAPFVSSGTGQISSDSYTLFSSAETGAWTIKVYRTASGVLVNTAAFTCQYAPALQCSSLNAMPASVSTGQKNIKSQTLVFQNSAQAPGAGARMDSFTLSFLSSGDTPQDIDGVISKVTVKKGVSVVQTFNDPSGTSLDVVVLGGETIAQGSSADYDIYLDFSEGATPGLTLKTSVRDSAGVSARDINSDSPVSPSGAFPLSSNAASVQNKACLLSSSTNYMPATITQGQTDVSAQAITFSNTASSPGSSLRIDSFRLSLKDAGGSPQDAAALVRKIRLKFSGSPVQTIDYPSGDSFVLNFTGTPQYVSAGSAKEYDVYLDFYDTAAAGLTLKTMVETAAAIDARDAVSGDTVLSYVSPSWPLASSAVTIQSTPSLRSTAQNYMPDTVGQGQYNVRSQRFFFANTSPAGGAAVKVYSFVLSFRDKNNNDTSITDVLDSMVVKNGAGVILQTISMPEGTNAAINFSGDPKTINQAETLIIDVFLSFSPTAPKGKTFKTLIKDTVSLDAKDANSGNTIVSSVYPSWPLQSETTTIESSVVDVRTYRDADRTIEQVDFAIGQKIYSKAWGLTPNTDYRSIWKDPAGAVRKNTTIKTDVQGIFLDLYNGVGTDTYGFWTVTVTNTGGSTQCSEVFRMKGDTLKFITPEQTIKSGATSSVINLVAYNPDGDTDVQFNETVALTGSSDSRSFSTDGISWTPAGADTYITFVSGQGNFYYKDYKTGFPVISASREESDVEEATHVLIVSSASVSITSYAFTIRSNETSPMITVIAEQYYGETDTTFNGTAALSSGSPEGRFSASAAPWSDTTVVTFASGVSTFYYRDARSGTSTLTIVAQDLSDSQSETITGPVLSVYKHQRNIRTNPSHGDSTTSPIYALSPDTIEYSVSIYNSGTETATAVVVYDTAAFDTSVNHPLVFAGMDTSPAADSWSYTIDPNCVNWESWGSVPAQDAVDVKGVRWKLSALGILQTKEVNLRVRMACSSGMPAVEDRAVVKIFNNLSGEDTKAGPSSNTVNATYTAHLISIKKYIMNIRSGTESDTMVSMLTGDTIEFRIDWAQPGEGGPAETITLTDSLSPGTAFVTGSETVTSGKGSVNENAGGIIFNANSVSAGETGTFRFRVTID